MSTEAELSGISKKCEWVGGLWSHWIAELRVGEGTLKVRALVAGISSHLLSGIEGGGGISEMERATLRRMVPSNRFNLPLFASELAEGQSESAQMALRGLSWQRPP